MTEILSEIKSTLGLLTYFVSIVTIFVIIMTIFVIIATIEIRIARQREPFCRGRFYKIVLWQFGLDQASLFTNLRSGFHAAEGNPHPV